MQSRQRPERCSVGWKLVKKSWTNSLLPSRLGSCRIKTCEKKMSFIWGTWKVGMRWQQHAHHCGLNAIQPQESCWNLNLKCYKRSRELILLQHVGVGPLEVAVWVEPPWFYKERHRDTHAYSCLQCTVPSPETKPLGSTNTGLWTCRINLFFFLR